MSKADVENDLLIRMAEVLDTLVGKKQCPRVYYDHEHVGFSFKYALVKDAQELVAAVNTVRMLGTPGEKTRGRVVECSIDWNLNHRQRVGGYVTLKIVTTKTDVRTLNDALVFGGFGPLLGEGTAGKAF